MSEQSSLVNDIKLVLDITSRVDERVKIIAESQQQMNTRLNHFIDEHNTLASRVTVLESKNINKIYDTVQDLEEKVVTLKSRIGNLEEHKQSILDKSKQILGFVYQAIFIIAVCYILYKLGISSPPIP